MPRPGPGPNQELNSEFHFNQPGINNDPLYVNPSYCSAVVERKPSPFPPFRLVVLCVQIRPWAPRTTSRAFCWTVLDRIAGCLQLGLRRSVMHGLGVLSSLLDEYRIAT